MPRLRNGTRVARRKMWRPSPSYQKKTWRRFPPCPAEKTPATPRPPASRCACKSRRVSLRSGSPSQGQTTCTSCARHRPGGRAVGGAWGGGRLPILHVVDGHGFDRVGEREPERARVEVELGLEGALDGLGTPEAVLLTFECHIGDRHTPGAQRLDHALGLVRR